MLTFLKKYTFYSLILTLVIAPSISSAVYLDANCAALLGVLRGDCEGRCDAVTQKAIESIKSLRDRFLAKSASGPSSMSLDVSEPGASREDLAAVAGELLNLEIDLDKEKDGENKPTHIVGVVLEDKDQIRRFLEVIGRHTKTGLKPSLHRLGLFDALTLALTLKMALIATISGLVVEHYILNVNDLIADLRGNLSSVAPAIAVMGVQLYIFWLFAKLHSNVWWSFQQHMAALNQFLNTPGTSRGFIYHSANVLLPDDVVDRIWDNGFDSALPPNGFGQLIFSRYFPRPLVSRFSSFQKSVLKSLGPAPQGMQPPLEFAVTPLSINYWLTNDPQSGSPTLTIFARTFVNDQSRPPGPRRAQELGTQSVNEAELVPLPL